MHTYKITKVFVLSPYGQSDNVSHLDDTQLSHMTRESKRSITDTSIIFLLPGAASHRERRQECNNDTIFLHINTRTLIIQIQ